jgi:8-oxo-dGTP pyrophosphatase MutT (NUDIX family)
MATVRYGNRLGKQGRLGFGCSAVIWDHTGDKILLTQRTDNGRWCLPGGGFDPGESVEECCIREVFEETGLHIRVKKLIGVYSNPHLLVDYPDGSAFHIVALNFEGEVVGGTLQVSNETAAYGYFSPEEMAAMDVMEHHRERILDAMAQQATPFIR